MPSLIFGEHANFFHCLMMSLIRRRGALADLTTINSTSTNGNSLDELAGMLDSCLEQLTPLAAMGERIET